LELCQPSCTINQQSVNADLNHQHLTSLCWYWHSWLYLERAQAEICVIITRSAWNHSCLHSNHHSPCLHGFKGSKHPQHQLSWCFCTKAYASVISWQNGRLGQYKQLPSLSRAISSSPYSAPEVWVANALTQHVPEMQFFFCVSTIKTTLFQLFVCQICSLGSVVRAVRYITERLPVLIQAVCFCPRGESARTLFKSSESNPTLSNKQNSPHAHCLTVPRRGPTPLATSVCERIFFHFCLTTALKPLCGLFWNETSERIGITWPVTQAIPWIIT
jgi:hypothetical protein